ncbi:MAG TPA: 3-oxoacyl-ACP synthase [Verrucomicrobia bacterium]|nr:MAG: 3-oxoacyl-ACP synthase [Lentisphaerae bacterium GWF2_57_35]HBA86117.1 3-oxoacyl-ACP synthase [Verrucomicrobiota bacterium]
MAISVRAVATSNPPLYVTQQESFDYYTAHFDLKPDERELYRRILLEGSIRGRYIGMDCKDDAHETNPDRLNERFLKYARRTAADAARKAMTEAQRDISQIGGLVVNTCTGYLCPGLSSYLVEDLRLGDSVKALDMAGMGCGGALPNLECAAGLIARGNPPSILSVSVEICSATLFMGSDPGLIVSNSIFGDGAAACIVENASAPDPARTGFQLLDFEAGIFPQHREQLRYRQEGGRLRNVLSRKVPVLGAKTARTVLDRLLQRRRLPIDAIRWWAVHAGGTTVLDQVGKELGLNEDQLRYSTEVFRDYGNMSSPTVLFVMKSILEKGRPASGDKGILVSFGAGFSAYACLVEFN